MSAHAKPHRAARAARRSLRTAPAWAIVTVLAATGAPAQGLAERVDRADGVVRFHYAAAPGVYGADDAVIVIRRDGGISVIRGSSRFNWGHYDEWRNDCPCEPGPVHIALRKDGRRIETLDMAVGARGPGMSGAETDLGEVAPQEAAEYLLRLAGEARARVAKDAIMAATLARDVTLWPGLTRLARDRDVDEDVRESAIFWLGQEAAEEALGELEELALDDDEDIDIRKRAIFSLSQYEGDDPVPTLIDLARSERLDARLRKHAMFWLAQHDDERVVDFFEAILRGG